MKKQLIALLLIAVITISVVTAVGVTTTQKAAGTRPKWKPRLGTTLRLTWGPSSYQGPHGMSAFTVTGTLKDSRGIPVPYKPVRLAWYNSIATSPTKGWRDLTPMRTNKNGVCQYRWGGDAPNATPLRARFPGDAAYRPSNLAQLTVPPQ